MKECIVVAGMHRSGTSALAMVLDSLGIELGSEIMEKSDANPRGYFEHAGIVRAHDILLGELSRTWRDPRPLPAGWEKGEAAEKCRRRLRKILRHDFTGSGIGAVKDPRVCRLVPLWLPMFEELNIEPRFVIPLRHPGEVADSLRRRDGLAEEISGLIWVAHLLEAERATRAYPRAFVSFDRLVDAPADVLAETANALKLSWPSPNGIRKAQALLDPSLRNAGERTHALGKFGRSSQLVETCWENLIRANGADSAELSGADENYSAYLEVLKEFDPIEIEMVADLRAKVHSLELAMQDQNERIERLTRKAFWFTGLLRRCGRLLRLSKVL